jgi:hypothetical protein
MPKSKQREWQIIRMRAQAEYLGTVKASDEAALKAVLKAFALDKRDAERLLVRQYGTTY